VDLLTHDLHSPAPRTLACSKVQVQVKVKVKVKVEEHTCGWWQDEDRCGLLSRSSTRRRPKGSDSLAV
jgi:hypothetical protein